MDETSNDQDWHELRRQGDARRAGERLADLARYYRQHSMLPRAYESAALEGRYEDLRLKAMSAGAYDAAIGARADESTDDDAVELTSDHSWFATALDALDAELFVTEKAKGFIQVTNGGWREHRAAEYATRFAEGVQSQGVGKFADLWALWRHGMRRAIIAHGACLMFFLADKANKRIAFELEYPHTSWFETEGDECDRISSVGRVVYWSPAKVVREFSRPGDEEFNEELKRAVARNATTLRNPEEVWSRVSAEDARPDSVSPRIPLIQAWTTAAGEDEPGSYMCILHCGMILESSDYTSEIPPCELFCPYPELSGRWGVPRGRRIIKAQDRYDMTLSRIQDALDRSPMVDTYYKPGTIDVEKLSKGKNHRYIPVAGNPSEYPVTTPVASVSPEAMAMLELHRRAIFDLLDLTEGSVTASNQRDLSGVAIRLVQNQQRTRLSPVADDVNRCMGAGSTRQIIRCAQEIGPGMSTWWKSEAGRSNTIDSSLFESLSPRNMAVSVKTVSGQKNSPADNIQFAKELVEVGLMPGQAYATISQNADIQSALNSELVTTEEQFMEQQIDLLLFGAEDELDELVMPEKWMDQDGKSTVKVGAAYLRARMWMRTGEWPGKERRLAGFQAILSKLSANASARATLRAQSQQAAAPAQAQG